MTVPGPMSKEEIALRVALNKAEFDVAQLGRDREALVHKIALYQRLLAATDLAFKEALDRRDRWNRDLVAYCKKAHP